MSRWHRIEKEYARFIRLGEMMDEDWRQVLAEQVFFHLFEPGYDALTMLEKLGMENKFPQWYRIFSKLLGQKKLQELTWNNEDLALSVGQALLNWAGRTQKVLLSQSEYHGEIQELNHFQTHHTQVSFPQWEALLTQLSERYPRQVRNWSFYQEAMARDEARMAQADGLQRNRLKQDLQIIRQNILQDWDRLLAAKKLDEEEQYLQAALDSYMEELGQKIGELHELGDLLAPFYNFLGHVWNDTLNNWNRINWDKLKEAARDLERDRNLRELAELLGRWQRAEHAVKEKQLRQIMPQEFWKPNPYGKSEIVGIHHSDQLSALLPSEVALLSSPETELIFSKKYVEKKLLNFQYRAQDMGTKPVEEEHESEQETRDERGPMILCIDTSGSMFGGPERMAKALALAILNLALKQKRRAYLISFSTGINTLEMTGIEEDLTDLLDFLQMSFHGGTDLQPAMTQALMVLQEENFRKADVLVISDFVIPRIDRKLFRQIQATRQANGTRFHSLYITRRPDPDAPPLPIFDNHWVFDLDQPGVMRQAVQQFQTLEAEAWES